MNMKKVAALPLAVVAMGLASCNKNWPLVTDEESITIANNIKNVDAIKKLFTGDLSGFNDIANYKATVYGKETYGKSVEDEQTFNIVANFNKDKNYFSRKITGEGIQGDLGKMSAESTVYYTYKDGYTMGLNKETKLGIKHNTFNEDQYKAYIKQQFYGELTSNENEYAYLSIVEKGYKMLTDWSANLNTLKTLHDKYKDNKDFYVNYETRSNDKTDSAQFSLDAKTKEDFMPQTNSNKDPDYEYVISKVNVTYVHGIITKMSYTWEGKHKDEDTNVDIVETGKGTLESINFGSASVDNINLDDYEIVEL